MPCPGQIWFDFCWFRKLFLCSDVLWLPCGQFSHAEVHGEHQPPTSVPCWFSSPCSLELWMTCSIPWCCCGCPSAQT
jgi:hypothetical protein